MPSVAEKVIEIISQQTGVDTDNINRKSPFVQLNLDELDLIELVMEFEDIFDIEIPDEANVECMKTVGELIDEVEERIGKKK